MIEQIKNPKYVSYAMTWSCSGRCVMCGTWQMEDDQEELSLDEIRDTFSDHFLTGLYEIILSGGEPGKRKDLKQIIEALLQSTSASIGITSNGLHDSRLKEIIDELSFPVSIYLSLDGPNAEVHDKIRGVSGSFEKINGLVQYLKEKQNVNLSLGMTVIPLNADYIQETKGLCDEWDVGFGIRLYEESLFFHNTGRKIVFTDQQKETIISQLSQFDDPQVNDYNAMMIKFLRGNTTKKPFDCKAGNESFFLSPNGDITLCAHYLDQGFGNVKRDSLESIFTNMAAKRYLAEQCPGCLNACEYSWSRNVKAI